MANYLKLDDEELAEAKVISTKNFISDDAFAPVPLPNDDHPSLKLRLSLPPAPGEPAEQVGKGIAALLSVMPRGERARMHVAETGVIECIDSQWDVAPVTWRKHGRRWEAPATFSLREEQILEQAKEYPSSGLGGSLIDGLLKIIDRLQGKEYLDPYQQLMTQGYIGYIGNPSPIPMPRRSSSQMTRDGLREYLSLLGISPQAKKKLMEVGVA